MSCRGPDLRPLKEVFVDQDRERLRVRDRRHAPDGEARALPYELGVGPSDRLADERRDLALVDAIGTARDDQHRTLALLAAKDQRLRDLIDLAADRGCRLRRGPRRLRESNHGVTAAGRGQRVLNPPDARAEVAHEPSCRTARATSVASGRT